MTATTDCTTAHDFTRIAVADILDHLADAVDYVRGSTAPAPWQRAVDAAWDYLLQADVIEYDLGAYALRVESATTPGTFYVSNGSCQCRAFTHGASGVCWHRAAARLVRRALEARERAEQNALAAELVQDAHEAGCTWYGAAEGLVGATMRHDELAEVAREWDAGVAAQRAALGARIGRAQARTMARPLAA